MSEIHEALNMMSRMILRSLPESFDAVVILIAPSETETSQSVLTSTLSIPITRDLLEQALEAHNRLAEKTPEQ